MGCVQVPGVRRGGPVAYAHPRTAGGIVHLGVETVEGAHAAFCEQADGGLYDVAVPNERGGADEPGLLGGGVASIERDLILVIDADMGIIGPVRAVFIVASVNVNFDGVLLPWVRG